MTVQFSFSFTGNDIDEDVEQQDGPRATPPAHATADPPAPTASTASAFPVQGKPLLPAAHHDLDRMLSLLPSKVAYSTMAVDLDGKGVIHLPRRELWDVRLQLMAESEAEDGESELQSALGRYDVKTGIYEGGFKSWESSVDLVKVLAAEGVSEHLAAGPCRVIELGCGTALPSLALFQWASVKAQSGQGYPLVLTLADYNPSVLYLVTLPNFLLAWALQKREEVAMLREALSMDGEFELTPEILASFKSFLLTKQISLSFLSGGWSADFVELLYKPEHSPDFASNLQVMVLGAETIYSPFAQTSFGDVVLSILQKERADRPGGQRAAIVAAKKLYFGVGGSLDDFVARMRQLDIAVDSMREETSGVRRGVVRCLLP